MLSVPCPPQDLVARFLEGSERDSSHEISSLSAHLFSSDVVVRLLLLAKRVERGCRGSFSIRGAGSTSFRSGNCRHSGPSAPFLADGRHQPEGLAGRSRAPAGTQRVHTRL